ncbi:PP2C family protein-serine/threonine phosphatase [Paludisphaera mucosa]|uniref:SpoIIE family protein phosphatase n=1 Tax=Paludisphaera mucosa TaxID=3030827 RepID=A0ABT6FFZ4_9BACT|nr:SpoIIE family protein phosphatase [Paludisphaera mucosa]MDG3006501.1 SpoIIE family protein phosphatase [Paludisphaera mucosa]
METRDASILVVDDDEGVLRAVSRILARRQNRVVAATSGPTAIATAREESFDLAIVDVRMPEMNGFDLMRALKRDQPDLDVILMTGNVEEPDENLLRAIDEGAYYFIQKPFDRRVMLALVNRCLELRRLREERERFLDRVGRELEEARQFQLSLLPPPAYSARGLAIAARCQASNELAGDIYDYAETRGGGVSLLIADVAGHGTSAAMVTGVVKAGFRASHVDDFEPCKVVERIREGIRDFDPGRFVTLCCVRIHPDRDELIYVNAGHPEAFIRDPSGGLRSLHSTGPILSSALCDFPCEQLAAPFAAGGSLLLYTDGVTEARSPRGMFGFERMLQVFRRPELRGAARLDALLDAVRTFAGGSAFDDDVTVLTLDRDDA